MTTDEIDLKFSITPFYVTRQFYYALEKGIVQPENVNLAIEYNHSPVKDHVLICGRVDATTMSMGKFLLAKTISDTYAIPVDPFTVAASLTYERGNGLFVPVDSGIDGPQDLVGKRLGIHDKSMVTVYHKAILEDLYDVSVDDIDWVFDTHHGLTTQIEAGTIDAVERVGDFYWNLATSPDHEMLYDMGEKWNELKGYYPIVHIIAVDKSIYDDHPTHINAFVDSLQQSGRYRDEHYDDILQDFSTEEHSETEWTGDKDVETLRSITNTVRCPFTMGETQRQNYTDWMEYAVRYGVLHEPIEEERLYPV